MADSNSHFCIPHALRSLYEPQLNQFGITPHPNGDGWSGTGESQWGHGSAWGAPLGDSCIVFSHEICIEREMALTESPQSAYACVCLVSEDTQATMPKMIARPRALLDGRSILSCSLRGNSRVVSKRAASTHRDAFAFFPIISKNSTLNGPVRSRGCSRDSQIRGTKRNPRCNHDNPFRNRAATRTWLRAAPGARGSSR